MKDVLSKGLSRRIEFISLVSEKPCVYSELDLAEMFGMSEQMIRLDAKMIRDMGIMLHSRKNRYCLDSNINLQTLNNLILTYLSLNQSDNIRNLKMIKDNNSPLGEEKRSSMSNKKTTSYGKAFLSGSGARSLHVTTQLTLVSTCVCDGSS